MIGNVLLLTTQEPAKYLMPASLWRNEAERRQMSRWLLLSTETHLILIPEDSVIHRYSWKWGLEWSWKSKIVEEKSEFFSFYHLPFATLLRVQERRRASCFWARDRKPEFWHVKKEPYCVEPSKQTKNGKSLVTKETHHINAPNKTEKRTKEVQTNMRTCCCSL